MALYSRDSSLFWQSVRGVSCGHPVDGGCDPDRWAGVLGRLDTLRLGSLAGCAPSHHEPYSLAVTREAGERREGRDPKFEVPKTLIFGPRTLARPTIPARRAILLGRTAG